MNAHNKNIANQYNIICTSFDNSRFRIWNNVKKFLSYKKEGETLVKENIMTFVSIHELAHLMTKSIGHEPEFWANFKLLLKISIDNGIYKNIDFNSTPKPYCGINITDTPLKKDEL